MNQNHLDKPETGKLSNAIEHTRGHNLTHHVLSNPGLNRSAKKIRKTRKYDIITTPAERVEMAPLNEENDEDDDSTLFDVKYR